MFGVEKNNSVKYDKLIRDKIPEIIAAKGSEAIIEILDAESYRKCLDIKLVEEVKEYLEDGSAEELADIVEVVYALLEYKGVSREEFEKIRIAKVEERGAFKKRLFLKEVINGIQVEA